jgi:Rrf2 family protein
LLDKQTLHALELVAHIACAPAQQSMTTATLARQLGLSITYVEGLMKLLKRGDLLQAHRGPGGGYRLQRPVEDISAGDVAKCFAQKEAVVTRAEASAEPSPERLAVNQFSVQFDDFTQDFLQAYPMTAIVDAMDHPPAAKTAGGFSLHLKDLPKTTLPSAPNSVFDLCNFTQHQASYGSPANKLARKTGVRPVSSMVEKFKPFAAHSSAWVP